MFCAIGDISQASAFEICKKDEWNSLITKDCLVVASR